MGSGVLGYIALWATDTGSAVVGAADRLEHGADQHDVPAEGKDSGAGPGASCNAAAEKGSPGHQEAHVQ